MLSFYGPGTPCPFIFSMKGIRALQYITTCTTYTIAIVTHALIFLLLCVYVQGWKIDELMMDIFHQCWTTMNKLHTIKYRRTFSINILSYLLLVLIHKPYIIFCYAILQYDVIISNGGKRSEIDVIH